MGKSLAGHVTALHRAVEAVPPSGHAVTDHPVPGEGRHEGLQGDAGKEHHGTGWAIRKTGSSVQMPLIH